MVFGKVEYQCWHYAKILDRKISEDMKLLRDKFKQQQHSLTAAA
jgi:hypothetical protein